MNDFENYLQEKITALKARREREGKEDVSEDLLYQLILMEITSGELYIIQRDFPRADIDPIIEKCIYVEARRIYTSPEDALLETKRQMENRARK